jgi:thiol-disulfide isomerase/thioredoxin
MGKASRGKGEDGDRRKRIAAQREAARRAEQRKRIYLAGGSILVVAIVVVAFVIFKLNSSSATAANGPTGAALTAVTKQVTGVSPSVTDQVADGGVPRGAFVAGETPAQRASADSNVQSYMATVNGTVLKSGGKPEVLYIGGEYCPFCAAERWAMVNAFSRFGTFTGLSTTHSSSTDVYPNTPTYSFAHAKYTSKYVDFTMVEQFGSSNTQIIQTPTAAQEALATKYDGSGSIPFIDLGNKYVEIGNLSPLSPSMLTGKTWAQVAAAMNDPSSAAGKALIGNANYLTAATCALTGNQPASACTPAIQKLEANFAK